MTDKQIITLEGKSIVEYFEQAVENKKLKDKLYAKEQECERLKEDYTLMKQSRDLALKNYDEEFEYKRQITVEHLEQKKELFKQLDQLKADIINLHFKLGKRDGRIHTLYQTLQEIKEIVSSTLDCGEWIGQGDNKMEQILNKISEVENEHN